MTIRHIALRVAGISVGLVAAKAAAAAAAPHVDGAHVDGAHVDGGADDAPEADDRSAPHDAATSSFVARAAGGLAGRAFGWRDAVTPNLRPYALGAAPFVDVDVAAYPLAWLGARGGLADLGLHGAYGTAAFVSSVGADGAPVSTAWSRFDVGARARLRGRVGAQAFVLALDAAYGGESFSFDAGGRAAAAQDPAAGIRYVRPGVSARLPFGRWTVEGSAAYLAIVGVDGAPARVAGGEAGGVDAGLAVGVAIGRGWELGLRGDYRRVFYAFHPSPGDAIVAGGALDQTYRTLLGVTYAY